MQRSPPSDPRVLESAVRSIDDYCHGTWLRRSIILPAAVLGSLVLTACSPAAGLTVSTASTPIQATTATSLAAANTPSPLATAAPSSPATTTSTATAATIAPSPVIAAAPAAAALTPTSARVNANSATIAQLQAAFEAAGISNAARWAREVDEYRPYPTNDPSFAKLRGELAKYNPGAETLEKILATLSL